MITATWLQATTYLLGVCPFSIAFLVFLNSSVSFVVTDLIHYKDGIGDAVGTLGFADELLALIACPFWGVLSDRIGVRAVCVSAYLLIALALVVFVQCKNVYPQLLLGRLFFSLGGAAASTMVTAVLPTMSASTNLDKEDPESARNHHSRRSSQEGGSLDIPQDSGSSLVTSLSVSSEQTITPANCQCRPTEIAEGGKDDKSSDYHGTRSSSKIAGYVGIFSGCGALLALVLFLPLPERFQSNGHSPEASLKYSYYIVAAVAFLVSICSLFGLRGLRESAVESIAIPSRPWSSRKPSTTEEATRPTLPWKNFQQAILLGFQRKDISLGYVGGFVARASSVAISLFVPLLINATFDSSRLCGPPSHTSIKGLPDLKRDCSQAYVLAAELTGVSQFVALLCAPLFGYTSARFHHRQGPLMFASAAGVVGYILVATRFSVDTEHQRANAMAFLSMCLIGISQIGAIVCSLGVLSGGVLEQRRAVAQDESPSSRSESGANHHDGVLDHSESTPLMGMAPENGAKDLSRMKGSIAGIYSLYGGAGILLLTKLGGFLFDRVSFAAPFYMMAIFNAILLLFCVSVSCRDLFAKRQVD